MNNISYGSHIRKYSVVSEIDEVMGDKDTLSTNDLDKLTYTNAVSILCE